VTPEFAGYDEEDAVIDAGAGGSGFRAWARCWECGDEVEVDPDGFDLSERLFCDARCERVYDFSPEP
jgi:hypothetical protein